MKTLIKQSLIVALLYATLTSYASSVDPLVKVEESENKIFTLFLNDLNLQKVQIFIKDKNGLILHSEDLSQNSRCIKKYDLRALPLGEYLLEIENESLIKMMPFAVKKFEVSFLKKEEIKIFKPYIRQRGKFIDIMFKGDENNATRVIIYNEDGLVLKREKLPAGENFERIYDMSILTKGSYLISFQQGNREFKKEITL